MKHLLCAAIALLAISSMTAASAGESTQAPSVPGANPAELPKVFAVRITVADLARSEKFYHEGLGAHIIPIQPREAMAQFASGPGIVLVLGASRAEGAPVSGGGPGGFLFQVADLDAVLAGVAAAGGTVERAPNAGGADSSRRVRSALIRDPDGVGIEIIQRPPG
jgi:catechol 2,3-dioxygenase-like lactoylglutathione lyase family enzyme